MTINDMVVVANLGEVKIYKAQPRDLEAEAGFKPKNVKLDLVNNFNYIDTHLNTSELLTSNAGRSKGSGSQSKGGISAGNISAGGSTILGQPNHPEIEREEEIIEMIAKDISEAIEKSNATKWHLALPRGIYSRVFDKISANVKSKLRKSVEKDLIKIDKSELIERF